MDAGDKGLIYRYHCIVTNKNYVGQTTVKNENRRQYFHFYCALNNLDNCAFHAAIRKHGIENFEYTIVERGINSDEELNEREKYWIAYYHSYTNGYNMTIGGDGVRGHYGQIPVNKRSVEQWTIDGQYVKTYSSISEAVIEHKIQASAIIRSCKSDYRAAAGFQWKYVGDSKIIIPINKKDVWNKGLKGTYHLGSYSEERKNNMSKNSPNARAVIQKTKDGLIVAVYPSAKKAAESIGLKRYTNICSCCQHKRSTVGGFNWEYKEVC